MLAEVLRKSRELNTTNCYWGYFGKWESCRGVCKAGRKKNYHFYLLSLLPAGTSYPVVSSSVFAINYFHKIVGHLDLSNSELVSRRRKCELV